MNKKQNIQQYLRLNYPILWNVKVFPALLFGLLINLFFFLLGYLASEVSFLETYSHSDLGLIYFFSVIATLLSFIVWMVFYARNNSIKRFYPMTSANLFLEWILTFAVIASFVLYPFSVYEGGIAREKSYMSKEEAIQGAEVLNMVGMLIPTSKYQYDKNNSYAAPEGQVYSLLDYHADEFNLSSKYDIQIKGYSEMRSLLVNEDVNQIKGLMDKFFELEKKHGLRSNITTDRWFEAIYNPPSYVVTQFEYIHKSADSFGRGYNGFYVNFDNLRSAYARIIKAYSHTEDSCVFLLVSLYFGLGISVLIFSFRVTSGKSWLIALVILGVVSLLWGFFAAVIGSSNEIVHFLFWIGLFVYLLCDLSKRLRNRSNKGRYSMLMNLFIWYLPGILLLVYGLLTSIARLSYTWDGDEESFYKILRNFQLTFMWLNLASTIVVMWFVAKFVRKWKSLPEE